MTNESETSHNAPKDNTHDIMCLIENQHKLLVWIAKALCTYIEPRVGLVDAHDMRDSLRKIIREV